MKRIFSIIIFLVVTTPLIGCGVFPEEKVVSTENPDAEEVLSMDPEADIFQYNNLIHVTGIEWIEEKSLTKDKQIGEILETSDIGTNFKDGTANELPIGSKIFTTKEESEMFLLVESEGKIIKYYALVEG